MRFHWLDPSETLPYDPICDVTVNDTRLVYSGNKGPAYVSLSLVRIPKLSKVPLYPGATKIETQDVFITTGHEDDQIPEHKITYITSATAKEVTDYYTTTMPEYGWYPFDHAFEPGTEKPIPNSIAFTWESGGVEAAMGAGVEVITASTEVGTKVELGIRGQTYFDR